MRHTLLLTVQFVGIANLVSGEINQPETQVWKPNLAHPLPSYSFLKLRRSDTLSAMSWLQLPIPHLRATRPVSKTRD
jgi:hypothetical protein